MTPVTYRVTHRTEYRYESEVTASYGQLHLLPRDRPGQVCRTSSVLIDPDPIDYRERLDFFGNRSAYFAIIEPHRLLSVTTMSIVDVTPRPATLSFLGDQRWEDVAAAIAPTWSAPAPGAQPLDPDVLDARGFVLDSRLVAAADVLADYGRMSFTPGRPIIDAVCDLSSRIHAEFKYKPGATSVTTTIDELLAKGEGVCQDFAHLTIGCLRSLGLAARYVSGYLETRPPPGQPRLQGADVSHAWASVFVPTVGWVDIDPTNDKLVDERYVTTAWGRDYSDVPPLKGVIYTLGRKHELEVSVDVLPL